MADRIIRSMSDKLDEKFMAIGGKPAKAEITSEDILIAKIRDLQSQVNGLNGRVKDLEARLDRVAAAACTDQASPGARGSKCEACGGRGSVAINPGRPDVVEPCMACRGLGRRV